MVSSRGGTSSPQTVCKFLFICWCRTKDARKSYIKNVLRTFTVQTMHWMLLQCSTVLYSVVQCCTVLYNVLIKNLEPLRISRTFYNISNRHKTKMWNAQHIISRCSSRYSVRTNSFSRARWWLGDVKDTNEFNALKTTNKSSKSVFRGSTKNFW